MRADDVQAFTDFLQASRQKLPPILLARGQNRRWTRTRSAVRREKANATMRELKYRVTLTVTKAKATLLLRQLGACYPILMRCLLLSLLLLPLVWLAEDRVQRLRLLLHFAQIAFSFLLQMTLAAALSAALISHAETHDKSWRLLAKRFHAHAFALMLSRSSCALAVGVSSLLGVELCTFDLVLCATTMCLCIVLSERRGLYRTHWPSLLNWESPAHVISEIRSGGYLFVCALILGVGMAGVERLPGGPRPIAAALTRVALSPDIFLRGSRSPQLYLLREQFPRVVSRLSEYLVRFIGCFIGVQLTLLIHHICLRGMTTEGPRSRLLRGSKEILLLLNSRQLMAQKIVAAHLLRLTSGAREEFNGEGWDAVILAAPTERPPLIGKHPTSVDLTSRDPHADCLVSHGRIVYLVPRQGLGYRPPIFSVVRDIDLDRVVPRSRQGWSFWSWPYDLARWMACVCRDTLEWLGMDLSLPEDLRSALMVVASQNGHRSFLCSSILYGLDPNVYLGIPPSLFSREQREILCGVESQKLFSAFAAAEKLPTLMSQLEEAPRQAERRLFSLEGSELLFNSRILPSLWSSCLSNISHLSLTCQGLERLLTSQPTGVSLRLVQNDRGWNNSLGTLPSSKAIPLFCFQQTTQAMISSVASSLVDSVPTLKPFIDNTAENATPKQGVEQPNRQITKPGVSITDSTAIVPESPWLKFGDGNIGLTLADRKVLTESLQKLAVELIVLVALQLETLARLLLAQRFFGMANLGEAQETAPETPEIGGLPEHIRRHFPSLVWVRESTKEDSQDRRVTTADGRQAALLEEVKKLQDAVSCLADMPDNPPHTVISRRTRNFLATFISFMNIWICEQLGN